MKKSVYLLNTFLYIKFINNAINIKGNSIINKIVDIVTLLIIKEKLFM
jgi:hypothetical protein